ncbi:MAG: S26 family signal peptidase [Actinobacteria bacterium]|nr:S26 family signal peptidase [Actinomycetota bacterium]
MANFRAPGSFWRKILRPGVDWPYRRAKVQGDSMAPTFCDGDVLLVKLYRQVPVDIPLLKVVLIEREVQPGIFYVKRIQKSHGGAYWVVGDNREVGFEELVKDSRSWGYIPAHEIRGRVIGRIGRAKNN